MLFKVVVSTFLCLVDFFPYFLEDCNGLFKEVDCNWNSSSLGIIFIR